MQTNNPRILHFRTCPVCCWLGAGNCCERCGVPFVPLPVIPVVKAGAYGTTTQAADGFEWPDEIDER